MDEKLQTILMSMNDSLNQIAENIALLSRVRLEGAVPQPPAFVVAAQEVLDTANEALEQAVKKSDENQTSEEPASEEDFEVGSRVKYVGKRESLAGKIGAVVEVKERGWLAIAWQGGETARLATTRLKPLANNHQATKKWTQRCLGPRLRINKSRSRLT